VEQQELAVGRGDVKTLRGPLEIVARALPGDLAIELSFRVLLTALIRLIDGDRNELGLQQLNNFWLGECRRTVEHAVVSRTAERMPIHGPNEDRLLLLTRNLLRVKQGDFPGYRPPWFVRRGLQLFVQTAKLRF